MGTSETWLRPPIRAVARVALAIGVGALGVVMAHYPMIFSGFRRIQTDLGDARLINYLLEHGYLWIWREPPHLDFWSPPFFFPAPNTAAYSDVLLSVGPMYWLYRLLGTPPDLSFGMWIVSMSVLNYAAGLLLLRKGMGFGWPAAVAGSALLAFGAPRLNQMNHPQLLPFFYPLLTLYALSRLVGDRNLGTWARAGFWMLAMAGLVAQLYAGVYLGWFSIVGLGLAAAVALLMTGCRGVMFAIARRDSWAIMAAGSIGALLLQPFLVHYLPAAREVGPEYILVLRGLHPSLGSWFDMGANHWVWGWTAYSGWAGELSFLEGEHHLGIGLLTPPVCALGFYLGRAWPICRLAAAVAFFIWLATTYMPGDQLAMLATAISSYCAAGLLFAVDEPGWRAAGLIIVIGLLILIRFPNPYLTGFALFAIILCVLEIARMRESAWRLVAPGLALAVVSLKMFDVAVILRGIVVVAPTTMLLAYYWRSWRREVGVGALVIFVFFSIMFTFLDQPSVLRRTLTIAPLTLAVTAPRRYRPPARLLLKILALALFIMVMFYHQDSLWFAYSGMIPGALAIRALGRVVLIMLVPLALGLASLVEILDRRRWAALGWVVVLLCLAEQGVTSSSFDAAANRATIDNLARRVDRDRTAFYYHPDDGRPFYLHHLDAMWASLSTKVPTINGYSGHAPRAWQSFFKADFDKKMDMKAVLAEWERIYSLPPERVQWIGPEGDAPAQLETR